MTIFELIGEGDSVRKANINDRESVQVKHGSILLVTTPPPPVNPRDKSSPSDPGLGLLKHCCPGGWGAGQIKNNFSLILCTTCHILYISRAVCTMESFFDRKTQKFVLKWQGMNKLSKLTSFLKVCFKISNVFLRCLVSLFYENQ